MMKHRVNMLHAVCVGIGFLCGLTMTVARGEASSPATPSARKIAAVEVGYIPAGRMTVSRDGRFLVLLSVPGERGSDCLVFDRQTHRMTTVPGSSRMEPLCFSHDGRRLWVWGLHLDEPLSGLPDKPRGQQFIALYDLRRERFIRKLTGMDVFQDVPARCVLSHQGKVLIYTTEGGQLSGFSTRTGRLLWRRQIGSRGGNPASIAFNGDGSKLLCSRGEEGDTQNTEVISTRTGRVLSTLHLPAARPGVIHSAFSDARFAPRGSQVAVFQSGTQEWVFFDSRTARVQWRMGGPSQISEGNLQWQWSPDARLVAVSGPRGLQVREARTGQILAVCQTPEAQALAFARDGSRLYTLTEDDTGFGPGSILWQWRLFPSPRQRRDDQAFMSALRRREAQFALSPQHINESLIQAARRGDPARVKVLLDHGANIETLDSHGDSPLVNAVWANTALGGPNEFYRTAKLLIERGANVRKRGGAMLAAAAVDNVPLLQLLLAHGAGVNDDASSYGAPSALFNAADFENVESVRLLLAHGANPNVRDEDGLTPLIVLLFNADRGKPKPGDVLTIARLLIEHGADVKAHSKFGMTALQATQNPKVKALLRQAGAKS